MPYGKKKTGGGMTSGIIAPAGGNMKPMQRQSANTDYDTIPTYLSYVKAIQEGNQEGAMQALQHINDVRGGETASAIELMGKQLGQTSLNDIARRSVSMERNPQLRQFYHMINENPDLINRFQYFLPKAGGGMMAGMR